MTKVVVFDYGFGNVRSMVRALLRLGLDVTLTSDNRQSLEADGLVIPGVGAFAACMDGIRAAGGDRVILERLRRNRPILGVCVGQQILFQWGVENGGEVAGLGVLGGQVSHLDADVVPHMGWDNVQISEPTHLLRGVETERFYFVHSYAAMSDNDLDMSGMAMDLGESPAKIAWCQYGRSRFVAAIEHGPLFATQFHPEKSAEAGSTLLRNWTEVL